MKNYQTGQIRNVSLIGNSGSGKTTLAECMLLEGGVIDRRGDVTAKNTVSDYRDLEHENGNSIFSTVLYSEYQDKKINFLDCPGLDDFSGGVISSLHVTDTAVFLINAQNGIEVGTEIQMRHAARMEKPIIFVINHLDHEKANYDATIEALKERMGSNLVSVQFPVSTGPGFNSVVDVILMKMLRFSAEGKVELVDIPESEMDKAEEMRSVLIEKAAESDESLMEIFFANDTLSEEEISQGIRAGLKSRSLFPVFCISAKKNMGVARLMEFIGKSVPSPDQMPGLKTTTGDVIDCKPDGPSSLFIYKTSIEQHIGEVSYFRVVTGEVSESMDMINTNNSTKERLAQLFVVAGKKREKVTKLVAGDLGATVKLKNSRFDQTLVTGNNQFSFEPVAYLLPKFRTAIKTKVEGEEEKLSEALNRIHLEDPTILIEHSKELKQILLHGQGEYHLNILKWHLDNVYKVDTEFLAPKIPYRETITKVALSMYRHKKQSGGSGQFKRLPFRFGINKRWNCLGEENWFITIVSSGGLLMEGLCLRF
jgi:elongation factor G